jgi:hypothetical protein
VIFWRVNDWGCLRKRPSCRPRLFSRHAICRQLWADVDLPAQPPPNHRANLKPFDLMWSRSSNGRSRKINSLTGSRPANRRSSAKKREAQPSTPMFHVKHSARNTARQMFHVKHSFPDWPSFANSIWVCVIFGRSLIETAGCCLRKALSCRTKSFSARAVLSDNLQPKLTWPLSCFHSTRCRAEIRTIYQ